MGSTSDRKRLALFLAADLVRRGGSKRPNYPTFTEYTHMYNLFILASDAYAFSWYPAQEI
jgi:hypothetical protein